MAIPNPDLAPYERDLAIIAAVSRESYELYGKLRDRNPHPTNAHANIVHQSILIAKATSTAIMTLLSQQLHLPSIVLTRVRLEQLITLSFLVHEQPEQGFVPYSRYVPIGELRTVSAVLSDPFLAPHVPMPVDTDALQKKALAAQLQINPGFDISNGKYQAKWTTLDLYSMAQRRDKLATQRGWLYSKHVPLAFLYTSFYRTASSPVHADGSMLAAPFWGAIAGLDGITRDASLFWAIGLPPYLATYDSLQCYEALRWYGINCDDEFVALTDRMIR